MVLYDSDCNVRAVLNMLRCLLIERKSRLTMLYNTYFPGHCHKFVEFFFIDTTPFVDKYWSPEQKRTFDWRGIGHRQTYLDTQLEVCLDLLPFQRPSLKSNYNI